MVVKPLAQEPVLVRTLSLFEWQDFIFHVSIKLLYQPVFLHRKVVCTQIFKTHSIIMQGKDQHLPPSPPPPKKKKKKKMLGHCAHFWDQVVVEWQMLQYEFPVQKGCAVTMRENILTWHVHCNCMFLEHCTMHFVLFCFAVRNCTLKSVVYSVCITCTICTVFTVYFHSHVINFLLFCVHLYMWCSYM